MIGFIWLIVGITVVAIVAPFVMRFVFPHHISWKEVGISVIISIIFSVVCTLVVLFSGKFNTEILNGKVVGKEQVQVRCEHSYEVCSGTGNNRVCTTYYEHNWDYDWMVRTTVGDIRISRVDRQGTEEPPRFSKVVVGEHVAMKNSYLDYLKGVDSSLFYRKNYRVDPDLQKLVPNYPSVYDYYRSKPVIFRGVSANKATQEAYNLQMRNVLKEIGGSKQVNIVVVIANTDRAEFQNAQTRFLDTKRIYNRELNSFVSGFFMTSLNDFPKIKLDEYNTIVAESTRKEFETGTDSAINIE
jgi:hypothetical protein